MKEATERWPEAEAPEGQSLLYAMGGVIGAFLIAAGLVLVGFSSYFDLPNGLRLMLALLPLSGALVGGGVVIAFDLGGIWREAAAVLIGVAFAAAVAVVVTVYDSIDSLPEFLSWVLLPVAGVVYLFHSGVLATLYVAILAAGFYRSAFHAPENFFWTNLLVAAAIMPFLARLGRSKRSAFAAQWGRLLLLAVSIIMFLRILNRQDAIGVHVFAWSVFLINFYYMGLASRRSSSVNVFLIAGAVGMLVFCLVFSRQTPIYRRLAISLQDLDPIERLTWMAGFGIYLWNLLQGLLKRRPVQYGVALILPGLALLAMLLPLLTPSYPVILQTLFGSYLIVGGIGLVGYGWQREKPGVFNFGLTVLGSQVMQRVAEYRPGLTVQLVVLGALLAGAVAANLAAGRRLRGAGRK